MEEESPEESSVFEFVSGRWFLLFELAPEQLTDWRYP
jgi:hypothetical protein